MTPNNVWQEIGAGENILTRLIRLLFILVAAVAFYFLAVLPHELAAAGRLWSSHPADGPCAGAQF